jgi:hypothetical protein
MPEEAYQQVSDQVRSSILKAIDASLAAERPNLERLGGVANAVARLADATDLYGKNTPGDGYAKNTALTERPELAVDPAEIVMRATRSAGEK